jgi:hypothetical protein
VSKKQNVRAPIRVTLDLNTTDYAALEKLERTMEAVSKADTIRRLVRFAATNPQIVNGRTV